ncbi:MAG: hypothetical protein ACC667_09590, partial [Longimicrobiales bacterium]
MGKMRVPHAILGAAVLPWLVAGCGGNDAGEGSMDDNVQELLNQYTTVRLTADLSALSDADRTVIRYLLGAM